MSSRAARKTMPAPNERPPIARAKAVYYPNAETGELRLARVQMFDKPMYNHATISPRKKRGSAEQYDIDEYDIEERADSDSTATDAANALRAARRARRLAFDLIMCNPALDTFVTLTYDPDKVEDRAEHTDVYRYLKIWLSNGVQRRDMQYICVPERHVKGGIHWHALCNHEAVPLVRARNAHSGRAMSRHGDPLYNVENWTKGFSTAQLIRQRHDGEDARVAVAKYMFKYMTKNLGAKVGGRYILHGGDLARPVEVYGEGVEEFGDPSAAGVWSREVLRGEDMVTYTEYDFLRGMVRS